MGLIVTDSQNYIDIADAIREVNETDETYQPSEMPAQVRAIPSKFAKNFIVNITPTSETTATADKTFAEIAEAYNKGCTVFVNCDGTLLPMVCSPSDTDVQFGVMQISDGTAINIFAAIKTDNTVEFEFAEIVLLDSAYFITEYTVNMTNMTAVSNHTIAEQLEAYENGKLLIATVDLMQGLLFPLLGIVDGELTYCATIVQNAGVSTIALVQNSDNTANFTMDDVVTLDSAYYLTTFTTDSDGTITPDHTYEEQLEAWQAGKLLLAEYEGMYVYSQGPGGYLSTFAAGDAFVTVNIFYNDGEDWLNWDVEVIETYVPTAENINALIDTKLGVIENGSY